MTEAERMLAGLPYRPADPALVAGRLHAARLLHRWHALPPDDPERDGVLGALLGAVGAGAVVVPPFHCDYGGNLRLGRDVFLNAGCVLLDPGLIELGDGVKLGPCVQVYTATHPLDVAERRAGIELARPVRIGADAWIGGGAVLLPGVTVGAGAVVGAGSVVTRDVAPGALVAGNPARARGPSAAR